MDQKKVKKFILSALLSGHDEESISNYLLSNLKKVGSDVGTITGDIGKALKILSQGGSITQQFGNYNPSLYQGINQSMTNTGVDIGVGEGTGVSLPEGMWKILEAVKGGFNKGYGNSVLAQNTNTGEKLRFSHLSNILTMANQILQGGQRIGATGRTGNVTGPHLDLEYYNPQGQLKDFLKSSYARSLM